VTTLAVGKVVAVNVVAEIRPDPHGDVGRTAIDKRPVEGPVQLEPLGPVGDTIMDRQSHGGVYQAVYAYAQEDLDAWSAELGRTVAPGQFGENLTVRGVDVTGALIGERWQVGGAELTVCSPRIPCRTFQDWMDEPHWVKRFTAHGAPGAYLSVTVPGAVQAGDEVEVMERPGHGVTVGDTFVLRRTDADRLRLLLRTQPDLDPTLIAVIERDLAVRAQ
jgi:MOSC domain-containing protein YiiM